MRMWDKKFSKQLLKRGKETIYKKVMLSAQSPVMPLQKYTVLKRGNMCFAWIGDFSEKLYHP